MPNYIQPELFLIISTGRTAQYVVNSTNTMKLNNFNQEMSKCNLLFTKYILI